MKILLTCLLMTLALMIVTPEVRSDLEAEAKKEWRRVNKFFGRSVKEPWEPQWSMSHYGAPLNGDYSNKNIGTYICDKDDQFYIWRGNRMVSFPRKTHRLVEIIWEPPVTNWESFERSPDSYKSVGFKDDITVATCPKEFDQYSVVRHDWTQEYALSKRDEEIEKKQREELARQEAVRAVRQEGIDSGRIVLGPNNSRDWVASAREVRGELELRYPIFEQVWPALAELIERVKDPAQVPTPSSKPFDDICKNKYSSESKQSKAKYAKNFGFKACAPGEENWAKLLTWYHPDLKNYEAVEDWSDFGYYREPQKLLFTQQAGLYQSSRGAKNCPLGMDESMTKAVSMTEINYWLSLGCIRTPSGLTTRRSWMLYDEGIANSYHYLFDLAERFNMRVAAIVADDTRKFAPESSLDLMVKRASEQIRKGLFESVRSDEDIRKNITKFGLYPELLNLYAAMVEDREYYEDEIAAYYEILEDTHVDTPNERIYRDFYDWVSYATACYQYGKGRALVYIDGAQYSEIMAIWDEQKKVSGLSKSERERIEKFIDDDPERKEHRATIKGNSWNDAIQDYICRPAYQEILKYQ